jgi:(p)ppGpp synthase/HD superfamily hydrolase
MPPRFLRMTGDNPPTADVYAGDTATPDTSASSIYAFAIQADAEPDVFARVAIVFNIANVAPQSATMRRESPDQVAISVAIELTNTNTPDMIRRKLMQLTCVTSVELTTQSGAPTAI